MIDFKAVGRRIAFYRKNRGFTQAYIAEKQNISVSYVSQIERGVTKISLPLLSDIAEILDVNIALLVSDTNIENPDFCNSELAEIISNWSQEQKLFLLEILKCADEQFRTDKQP